MLHVAYEGVCTPLCICTAFTHAHTYTHTYTHPPCSHLTTAWKQFGELQVACVETVLELFRGMDLCTHAHPITSCTSLSFFVIQCVPPPQAAYRAWKRDALAETVAALTALQQLPEFNALLEVCLSVCVCMCVRVCDTYHVCVHVCMRVRECMCVYVCACV
jgi:hypothetical protein